MTREELLSIFNDKTSVENLCKHIDGTTSFHTEEDDTLYAKMAEIVGHVGVFESKDIAIEFIQKTLIANVDEICDWLEEKRVVLSVSWFNLDTV